VVEQETERQAWPVELQNKLAVVIAHGELALASAEDGPARARLERMLDAAWQASRMVRDLAEAS
jgi:hypothetical protein